MDLRRDVFQAIADPTRRAILTLVMAQVMTPGAIAAHFDATRQTISKHIQILTACDLLVPEPQGREIYYQLNLRKMKDIADFVEPFRQLWEARFAQLDELFDQMQQNKS